MIISSGRRYIFVHIPKTGGTSLAMALEDKAMKDDILIGDTPKAKRRRGRVKQLNSVGRLWKHSKLKDIYGVVDQAQIENYFVFTLVRNPWDRMVSYYHWLQGQKFDHPAVKLAKFTDFTGFLNDSFTRNSLAMDGAVNYVRDDQGVDRCDLYVRLEHLAQDLPKLEAGIGIRLGAVPHENRSSRGAYGAHYSVADRDLVGDLFAKDIERFGYEFED